MLYRLLRLLERLPISKYRPATGLHAALYYIVGVLLAGSSIYAGKAVIVCVAEPGSIIALVGLILLTLFNSVLAGIALGLAVLYKDDNDGEP